jgi:hypothetical protein
MWYEEKDRETRGDETTEGGKQQETIERLTLSLSP